MSRKREFGVAFVPSTIVDKTRRELSNIIKDSKKQWTTQEGEEPVIWVYTAPLQPVVLPTRHIESRADGIGAIDKICFTLKRVAAVVQEARAKSIITFWEKADKFNKIDKEISVQSQEQGCLLFDKYLCSIRGKNTMTQTPDKTVIFALACLCLARDTCDTQNNYSRYWNHIVAWLSGGVSALSDVDGICDEPILKPAVCSYGGLITAQRVILSSLKLDVMVVSEIDICAVQERLWEASVLEFNVTAREHTTVWKILERMWRAEKSCLTWMDVGMNAPLTGTFLKSPKLASILLHKIIFGTNTSNPRQIVRVSLTRETWCKIEASHPCPVPAGYVLPTDCHVRVAGHYFQPVKYTGQWDGKSPAALHKFVRAFSRRRRLTISPYMQSPSDLFEEALAAFMELHG